MSYCGVGLAPNDEHDEPLSAELARAARLSRLPGMTLAAACARCAVSRGALERARKRMGAAAVPGPEDLLIAALSDNGARRSGALPSQLGTLASFIDYVNKDGCTTTDVRNMLRRLARAGILRIADERWTLVGDWP